MSVFSGPEIINDGLVFCYDMGNTEKSFKGAPVTNLAKNASNQIDWSVSNLTQSVTRSTIATDEVYRITSTTGTGTSFRIRFDNAVLVNGATYTISYRFRIISGGTTFRANDWCDATITRTTTALPESSVFYETATGTRATYDSTYRFLDFEISNNTVVEIWDLQLEQGASASPYSSNQIRTNTQALLDLTNRNTITANNLTYSANNTFSFDGTNNFISTSYDGTSSALTHEVFLRPTNVSKDQMYIGYNPITAQYVRIVNSQAFLSVATAGGQLTHAHPQVLANNTNYHIVSCYNGVQLKIYVNGVLSSSSANNQALSAWGIDRIGRWRDADQRSFVGTIFNLKTYNRELSAAEVLQNFEAARSRYGI